MVKQSCGQVEYEKSESQPTTCSSEPSHLLPLLVPLNSHPKFSHLIPSSCKIATGKATPPISLSFFFDRRPATATATATGAGTSRRFASPAFPLSGGRLLLLPRSAPPHISSPLRRRGRPAAEASVFFLLDQGLVFR